MKEREKRLAYIILTGIGLSNGGSGRKVTRTRSHGLSLEVAVESIRGVCLDGVRKETKAIRLKRSAISTRPTCIV